MSTEQPIPEKNPVKPAAIAGTAAIVGIGGLIEMLKTVHEISGAQGTMWQVASLVLAALWMLVKYVEHQSAQAAKVAAETAERERLRIEAQQRQAERQAERDEGHRQELHEVVAAMQGSMHAVQQAIIELQKGHAELTKEVRRWAGEPTRPGVPRPAPLTGNR